MPTLNRAIRRIPCLGSYLISLGDALSGPARLTGSGLVMGCHDPHRLMRRSVEKAYAPDGQYSDLFSAERLRRFSDPVF